MQPVGSNISIVQYWHMLKRRWLPASVVFVSTVAAVSVYGLRQTPIYEAEGKLRFKSRDSTSALTGLGAELGQLESLDRAENPITTEIGIMRTVPIIRKTIERLGWEEEEGDPYDPNWFLENLQIDLKRDTDILEVQYRSSDSEKARLAVDAIMAVYLEEHLLSNRAEAAAARVFIENQLPAAEQEARRTEAALRKFKEENQVISLDAEARTMVSSLDGLQNRMTDVVSELSDIQAQLNSMAERLGGISPQVSLLATAVSQSRGVQQVLESYQQVETQLATERVRFQDQHPIIVDLETQKANLEALLNERISNVVGSQTGPTNLNLQIGSVEMELISDYVRLDSRLRGLEDRAITLQGTEADYLERASDLPRLEQSQRELERQLEAAQSTYSLLLQRLQEVRVAENQNVGNVQVIQQAESLGGPVEPDQQLFVMSGIMLGGLLALALIFLLEVSDRSVRGVAEARAIFGLSILGVIPSHQKTLRFNPLRKDTETVTVPRLVFGGLETKSLFSESYYMLAANLATLGSGHMAEVIAVTSSVPLEGKSTVASNLAMALSRTGKRVLLIDANIQQPMQQSIFQPWILEPDNCPGLLNVLMGQATSEECIIEAVPNLNVFLAGTGFANYSEAILESQAMKILLERLKGDYDYVILDTPALSLSGSAAGGGALVDGMLLVVRAGLSHGQDSIYAQSLMAQSQKSEKMLGLVVNGVEISELLSWLKVKIARKQFKEKSVSPELNGNSNREVMVSRRY
ncbi:GumC family protein [Leptothoe spongobia]|uniref:non-specific protein-tyrosine kinase n=1 Tax=Leptothoe spongobia TAU-MAC 1115 TaxID=1967444 RepID=A0A947DFK2_9CYAN|nr:polysaccharide biosynthesis tyrosine autokinase [Leptothoe spongobia]MBT9315648.1 polysaccharide biosynthesis tyrosine autokinase [Leptothoe spongobia TAU-MAC 1115]